MGYFVPYISCVWFILPLYFRYIHNFINIFVRVLYMFTVICWCNSYNLLLGCTTSCEACCEYFLYMICYYIVAILIDMNSKKWINISLFELVFTCIKAHISVPSLVWHTRLINPGYFRCSVINLPISLCIFYILI